MNNRKEKTNHWSEYWQNGQLTSLPQDFTENYKGDIAKIWHAAFNGLTSNSKVLDICTGNLAIALLASQFSESKNLSFEISALDAAEIKKNRIINSNPHLSQHIQNITLLAGRKLENVCLPANHFDLITSQYGVEYTHWQKAARSIKSLLKTNGKFGMICHAHSSKIMATMKQEEQDYVFLFDTGFFNVILQFEKGEINYQQFMKQLLYVHDVIANQNSKQASKLLSTIYTIVGNILKSEHELLIQHKKQLLQLHWQYQSAFKRMQDVLNVGKAMQKEPMWYQVFLDVGLKLERKQAVITQNKTHLGDYYQFINNPKA